MSSPGERSTLTAASGSQQTTAQQQTREQSEGSRTEGLSLQTLVIAALASGTAAVVTSLIWPGGTVLSAAMTPVIVSLVREALQRPAQRIASARTGRLGETPSLGLRDQLDSVRSRQGDLKGRLRLPSLKKRRVFEDAPYARIYGRRGIRLKAAVATGLLAFVIAAVVLTLPELVFGGSVTGTRSTTFFGGGSPAAIQAPPGQGAPSDGSPSPAPSGSPGAPQGQGGSSGSSSGSQGEGQSPQGPSGQAPGSTSPNQATPQQPQYSPSAPTQSPTTPGGSASP